MTYRALAALWLGLLGLSILYPAPASAEDAGKPFAVPGYDLSITIPLAGEWEDETDVDPGEVPNWQFTPAEGPLNLLLLTVERSPLLFNPQLEKLALDNFRGEFAPLCDPAPTDIETINAGGVSWHGIRGRLKIDAEPSLEVIARYACHGNGFYCIAFYCAPEDEAAVNSLAYTVLSGLQWETETAAPAPTFERLELPAAGLSMELPSDALVTDYSAPGPLPEGAISMLGYSSVFDAEMPSMPAHQLLVIRHRLPADCSAARISGGMRLLGIGLQQELGKPVEFTQLKLDDGEWWFGTIGQRVDTDGVQLDLQHRIYCTRRPDALLIFDFDCLAGGEEQADSFARRLLQTLSYNAVAQPQTGASELLQLPDKGRTILLPAGGRLVEQSDPLFPAQWKKMQEPFMWLSADGLLLDFGGASMELSTPLSEEDYAEIRQQVSRHPISAGGMSLSPAGQDEITDSTGTVWQRYRFDSTDADLPVRVEIYLAEFPQRLQICGAAFWTEEDAQAHTMIEPALASLSGQQAPAGAAEAAPAASESD